MRILRRLLAKLPPRPERRYDLTSEGMARPFADPREAVKIASGVPTIARRRPTEQTTAHDPERLAAGGR